MQFLLGKTAKFAHVHEGIYKNWWAMGHCDETYISGKKTRSHRPGTTQCNAADLK